MIKINNVYFLLSVLLLVGLGYDHNLEAAFYKYTDKSGVLHFVDDPAKIPPEYRKDIKTYPGKYDHLTQEEKLNLLEKQSAEEEQRQLEQSEERYYLEIQEAPENKSGELADESQGYSELETQVIIRRNQVLVPAVLGYEGNELEVLLVLDTGADIIALHQDIADQLKVRISKVAKAQVAGGKKIRFKLTRLSYVQVGPHRMENVLAGIINYKGPPVDHDGLLGVNFLRHFEYSIDYKNKVIRWKPQS